MLQHLPGFLTLPLTAMTLGLSLHAQSTPACPERGVKQVDATWVASDMGVSCNSGIGFTFQGVTYTANDGHCPSQVEYTPGHKEPDHNTFAPCTRWFAQGTYTSKLQKYSCHGPLAGCGFLGLGYCCEMDSEEDATTYDNFTQATCEPCPKKPE